MSSSMSGLRVYINSESLTHPIAVEVDDVGPRATKVFYSRRGNGPIYRWLYEEKSAHWSVLRINTSDFDSHKLSNASWKSVPQSLQAQLSAHYLD
jgi:hypothetical protein